MGVNFDNGPLEGIGVAKIATDQAPTAGELEQTLRDATCQHIATVTEACERRRMCQTPAETEFITVTTCVTCHAHVPTPEGA